ncbi:MAG: DoxX family membrane protein [Lewinellaceae bacterium]|nr:DoxX family membrane protein [Phaeodactylibacter sp.]MCB9038209.1 DoxX family membrane protein [Lewinellaceae bacterium]
MNAVLNLGKYLFAVPFAIFGIFHLISADDMNAMIHPPGGKVMIYITGIALIAGAVSLLIGKMDKLAAVLLAVFLLLTAFLIHLSSAMAGDASGFLKDIMLSGAALMYAGHLAKDNAVIG